MQLESVTAITDEHRDAYARNGIVLVGSRIPRFHSALPGGRNSCEGYRFNDIALFSRCAFHETSWL
jgi:hypothetical protein